MLDVDDGGTLSLKELTAPFDDPTSISDPFFQGQIAPTVSKCRPKAKETSNIVKRLPHHKYHQTNPPCRTCRTDVTLAWDDGRAVIRQYQRHEKG